MSVIEMLQLITNISAWGIADKFIDRHIRLFLELYESLHIHKHALHMFPGYSSTNIDSLNHCSAWSSICSGGIVSVSEKLAIVEHDACCNGGYISQNASLIHLCMDMCNMMRQCVTTISHLWQSHF